jgi:hypothetical protein
MRVMSSVLVCGLALALVGCGDSHEKIVADQVAVLSEMNDVLGGVTDEASVEAAKPKFEALGERAESINTRAEKLAAPSEEQVQAIREKHNEPFQKEIGRMMANMTRLADKPEVVVAVQNAMPDVQGGPEWLSTALQFDMGIGGGNIQMEMHDMPEMPAFPDGPDLNTPEFGGTPELTTDPQEQP